MTGTRSVAMRIAILLMVVGYSCFAITSEFSPFADTYIQQSNPSKNYGAESTLQVGLPFDSRALISFKHEELLNFLSVGPIESAKLRVYISNSEVRGRMPQSIGVYRLQSEWLESQATWFCPGDFDLLNDRPDCNERWFGGNIVGPPSDTVLCSNGFTGFIELDVTKDLNAFLRGDLPNNGWILKKTERRQLANWHVVSREGPLEQRPVLVVTYRTRVMAWGENRFGQLGLGDLVEKHQPTEIPNFHEIRTLGKSGYTYLHMAGIKPDSTIWAWGWNIWGNVGDGSTTNRTKPILVPALGGVIAVSPGGGHTLALLANGTVMAWGYNRFGQLGLGDNVDRHSPVLIPGLDSVVEVNAGSAHSLALRANGTVMAWGANRFGGALGVGDSIDRNRPVPVSSLSDVASVSASAIHSVFLKKDGTVWACGRNLSGHLGDGTTLSRVIPVRVGTISSAVAIAIGSEHGFAILTDGTLMGWGRNYDGSLGDGTGLPRLTPIQIPVPGPVASISCGYNHTFAVLQDHRVFGWGWNAYGQLGDGTVVTRLSPVPIGSIQNALQIVAAGLQSYALMIAPPPYSKQMANANERITPQGRMGGLAGPQPVHELPITKIYDIRGRLVGMTEVGDKGFVGTAPWKGLRREFMPGVYFLQTGPKQSPKAKTLIVR